MGNTSNGRVQTNMLFWIIKYMAPLIYALEVNIPKQISLLHMWCTIILQTDPSMLYRPIRDLGQRVTCAHPILDPQILSKLDIWEKKSPNNFIELSE
jgi:hypothetical protein